MVKERDNIDGGRKEREGGGRQSSVPQTYIAHLRCARTYSVPKLDMEGNLNELLPFREPTVYWGDKTHKERVMRGHTYRANADRRGRRRGERHLFHSQKLQLRIKILLPGARWQLSCQVSVGCPGGAFAAGPGSI